MKEHDKKQKREWNWERFCMISVLFWLVFVCFSSLAYLTVGITLISSLGVLVCACAGTLCIKNRYVDLRNQSMAGNGATEKFSFFLFLFFIIDVILGIFFWSQRNDFPLQTPWLGTPWWIFFLFICSTLFFILSSKKPSRFFLLHASFHFFIMYGVVLIVFRYGFGYDPIIHQAAEQYVVLHGKIFPIQPFYIGQYASVAVLHFLTSVPVTLLDRILVPILAVFFAPCIAWIGFVRGWGCTNLQARLGISLLLLVPFAEFTFTVPHNVTFVYAYWFIFLFPLFYKNIFYKILLLLLACAALVTHPLLGVPLFFTWCAAFFFLRKKIQSWYAVGTIGIAAGLIVPVLFGIYRVLHGVSFFQQTSAHQFFESLILFMRLPYSFDGAPFEWILLYCMFVGLKLIIVIIGFFALLKSRNFWIKKSCITLVIALCVTFVFLVTLIHIPGIRESEQLEYAFRVRDSIPLFLLPFFITFLIKKGFFFQKKQVELGFFIVCSIVICIQWYGIYPHINPVTRSAGWNVSLSDIQAVQTLEKNMSRERYVVISDQLFAVVALRERGFGNTISTQALGELYPYPISANHYLSSYWYRLLIGTLGPQDLAVLKHDLGVERVYVAVHGYQVGRLGIERSLATNHALQVAQFPFVSLYTFQ